MTEPSAPRPLPHAYRQMRLAQIASAAEVLDFYADTKVEIGPVTRSLITAAERVLEVNARDLADRLALHLAFYEDAEGKPAFYENAAPLSPDVRAVPVVASAAAEFDGDGDAGAVAHVDAAPVARGDAEPPAAVQVGIVDQSAGDVVIDVERRSGVVQDGHGLAPSLVGRPDGGSVGGPLAGPPSSPAACLVDSLGRALNERLARSKQVRP